MGVVASVGLLLGFDPSQLPPALLRIAAYKLTFLAAFGLIAAGGAMARASRRTGSASEGAVTAGTSTAQLGAGAAAPIATPPLERAHEHRAETDRR